MQKEMIIKQLKKLIDEVSKMKELTLKLQTKVKRLDSNRTYYTRIDK